MNQPKKPVSPDSLEDLMEEDELPPMCDDRLDEPDPALLSDYLDEIQEDYIAPDSDAEMEGMSSDLADVERELISIDEGSWIDEREKSDTRELAIDTLMEEEDEWADDDGDEAPLLEDDWFEEEGESFAEVDSGDEGPLEDGAVEIDRSGWEDLEDWEEGDDEPIDSVLDRLGISIGVDDEDDETVGEFSFHESVDVRFLGPETGGAVAISPAGDRLVLVGDWVCLLGADGMFHNVSAVPEVAATSAVAHRELTFIGTERNGVLIMAGSDARLRSSNDWYSLGIREPFKTGTLETSIHLSGQRFGEGYRLLGCDGAGQIFESTDLGTTWRGPLLDGKCSCVAPVGGTEEVVAAVELEGNAHLFRSADLSRWTDLPAPASLESVLSTGRVSMAATADTVILAGVSPDLGPFITLDRGASWREVASVVDVCAVAVDPEDPAWMALAGRDPTQDNWVVRVSRDGGVLWNTAFVLDDFETAETGWPSATGPVTQLLVVSGATRDLYVVGVEGAYRISISGREIHH